MISRNTSSSTSPSKGIWGQFRDDLAFGSLDSRIWKFSTLDVGFLSAAGWVG